MTARYLNAQRHVGTVAEIAKVKFPFPSEEIPDMETITNVPKARIAVGAVNGKDLFPDIVVVQRPGQFLRMMAEVEMPDTVNDESATNNWAPLSKIGELFLYVPAGMVPETKALLKKHKIRVAGIRTWRFRPVWGLDIAET